MGICLLLHHLPLRPCSKPLVIPRPRSRRHRAANVPSLRPRPHPRFRRWSHARPLAALDATPFSAPTSAQPPEAAPPLRPTQCPIITARPRIRRAQARRRRGLMRGIGSGGNEASDRAASGAVAVRRMWRPMRPRSRVRRRRAQGRTCRSTRPKTAPVRSREAWRRTRCQTQFFADSALPHRFSVLVLWHLKQERWSRRRAAARWEWRASEDEARVAGSSRASASFSRVRRASAIWAASTCVSRMALSRRSRLTDSPARLPRQVVPVPLAAPSHHTLPSRSRPLATRGPPRSYLHALQPRPC